VILGKNASYIFAMLSENLVGEANMKKCL